MVVPLAAAVVVPGSAAVVVWPTELPTKQSAMKTARYFIVEVSRSVASCIVFCFRSFLATSVETSLGSSMPYTIDRCVDESLMQMT